MALNSMTGATIQKALSLVRLFRLQSGEMPMQQADVLLVIAAKPGLSMRELSDATGLAQSSITRNVAVLSSHVAAGQAGLGFVEALTDPNDARQRRLFLTSKGKAFVQQLLWVLEPGANMDDESEARAKMAPKPDAEGPSGTGNRKRKPADVRVPLMPAKR